MSAETILIEFHKNLIIFLDELIEQFPLDELITARMLVATTVPIEDIVIYAIQYILPYKEHIKNRNDEVFMNNTKLYDNVDKTTVNTFKKIWRSNQLDKQDRNTIWKWVDTFIFLLEKYQKEKIKDKTE